jgi:hypothetical protein
MAAICRVPSSDYFAPTDACPRTARTVRLSPGTPVATPAAAGEALSAAWLTATELAVSVVPMSATIESATGREKLRRLLGGVGYPYLVLCLARHIGLEDAHARCPCMPGWILRSSLGGVLFDTPPG